MRIIFEEVKMVPTTRADEPEARILVRVRVFGPSYESPERKDSGDIGDLPYIITQTATYYDRDDLDKTKAFTVVEQKESPSFVIRKAIELFDEYVAAIPSRPEEVTS